MRILSSIIWGIAGLLAGGGGAAILSGLSFMLTGIEPPIQGLLFFSLVGWATGVRYGWRSSAPVDYRRGVR